MLLHCWVFEVSGFLSDWLSVVWKLCHLANVLQRTAFFDKNHSLNNILTNLFALSWDGDGIWWVFMTLVVLFLTTLQSEQCTVLFFFFLGSDWHVVEVWTRRTNWTIHSDLVDLEATLFLHLISGVAVGWIGSLLSAGSCFWLKHCFWEDGLGCCFTVGF